MSSVTWRYLSGNTATFAIDLALVTDSTDDWMVDPEERASWGSLSLWVGGVNVCEQAIQGETLQAAHWYLLPVAEWLIEHWDPLLHEERLPAPSNSLNAARGFADAVVPAELDTAGQYDPDAIQAWYIRHGLRASTPGSILPDLYIRRYGDLIEFSTGSEPVAGSDWGLIFTQQLQAVRVPLSDVADALHDALRNLARVLHRRQPKSTRFQTLAAELNELGAPDREHSRFAWLSGAGNRIDDFNTLWRQVREAIPQELQQEFDEFQISEPVEGGVAMLAPPATLLFGSLSPDVSADDIVAIYHTLITRRRTAASVAEDLRSLGTQILASRDPTGLSPGQQGSMYGEEAWRRLADPYSSEVDIEQILSKLRITVDYTPLRDRRTRAVSMLSTSGSAHILANRNYARGDSRTVERFTLAHELGHLLLDQERAARMLVASGPWAPAEIEQRANAFAAAFLIPIPLLDATPKPLSPFPDIGNVYDTARTLGVSFTALVSRLQNIGRISSADAEILRSEVIDHRGDNR